MNNFQDKNLKIARIFNGTLALFFIFLITSWIFITPPGSGIDDDFHLPSIWCGQGNEDEICDLGKEGDLLGRVPEYVANAPFCIGYQPFESGACTYENFSSEKLVGARINELGLYMPNGYYYINSFFITQDFYQSIWLMRFLNLLIFFAFFTLAIFTKNIKNKLLLIWLLIANFNPLFLSVLTSNNNSSWFFASTIFLFFYLYTLHSSSDKKDRSISIIGISLVLLLALNSRTDNLPLILIMLTLFSFLIVKGRWLIAYFFILTLVATFIVFQRNIPGIGGFGITSAFGSIDPRRDATDVFTYNLLNLPKFLGGLLGGWGINWLDFRFSLLVSVSLQLSLFLLLFYSFRSLNKIFSLGLLGIALTFGLYFWVLQIDLNLIGEMVQPRYLYPLFSFSLGFIVFSSHNLLSLKNWKVLSLAILIALGNGGATYSTIRRYITGTDIRYWNLNELIEWWPLPITPMFFWIIWTITLFLAIIIYSNFSKKVLSKQI